jgi:hypothetical protein
MSKPIRFLFLCLGAIAVMAFLTTEVLAQRSEGGRGGAGGRSAGHAASGAKRHASSGPAMTRPGGGTKNAFGNAGGASNIKRPASGTKVPSDGRGGAKSSGGGFERPKTGNKPNIGNNQPSKLGGDKPRIPGKTDAPRVDRPKVPGQSDRPTLGARPGGGASSSQLNDFLGGGSPGGGKPSIGQDRRPNLGNDGRLDLGKNDRPDLGKEGRPDLGKNDRPDLGKEGRPDLGKDNRPNIGDRGNNSTNINVGDVNVGNSVDFSKNQKAWVDNRHTTGNQVRVNAGNRYASSVNNGVYRRGAVGGYPYYSGWNSRGAYFGWQPVTYAAFGAFMGAAWSNSQPRYIAYGTGGNVYYENNVVYVDGQAAGTPEEYAAQSTALVASAPEQVTDTEWLPLGTFALTREGVNDSQAMLELAVNKQGVLAGTYYNEATQVSRSLKGMLDQASQRAAIGFADGKNADIVLETGIQNLTQDEAPALLHQGKESSGPVLLVRLQAPEGEQQ